MKILILCTGNSCRSQIAEGLLKSYDSDLEVYSAGINPANQIHPKAVQVLREIGIDISKNKPKNVNQFLDESFDFVITVCDNAKETCPVFMGKVSKHIHIGFEDPAETKGTEEEILSKFRQIRNEIESKLSGFFESDKILKKKISM